MIIYNLKKRANLLDKKIPHLPQLINQTYDRDENNFLIIPINCSAELFNPYSTPSNLDLNEDLYSYLDDQIYYTPVLEHLHLEFCGKDFTAEEKEKITHCLKQHYNKIFRDKKQDLAINFITIVSLAIIGVIFLSISISGVIEKALLNETLSIIGSFAMWEAVDMYILERRYKRSELYNATQSAEALITFKNISK